MKKTLQFKFLYRVKSGISYKILAGVNFPVEGIFIPFSSLSNLTKPEQEVVLGCFSAPSAYTPISMMSTPPDSADASPVGSLIEVSVIPEKSTGIVSWLSNTLFGPPSRDRSDSGYADSAFNQTNPRLVSVLQLWKKDVITVSSDEYGEPLYVVNVEFKEDDRVLRLLDMGVLIEKDVFGNNHILLDPTGDIAPFIVQLSSSECSEATLKAKISDSDDDSLGGNDSPERKPKNKHRCKRKGDPSKNLCLQTSLGHPSSKGAHGEGVARMTTRD